MQKTTLVAKNTKGTVLYVQRLDFFNKDLKRCQKILNKEFIVDGGLTHDTAISNFHSFLWKGFKGHPRNRHEHIHLSTYHLLDQILFNSWSKFFFDM